MRIGARHTLQAAGGCRVAEECVEVVDTLESPKPKTLLLKPILRHLVACQEESSALAFTMHLLVLSATENSTCTLTDFSLAQAAFSTWLFGRVLNPEIAAAPHARAMRCKGPFVFAHWLRGHLFFD